MIKQNNYPDAFTFLDGTPVKLPQDWSKRKEEILNLYQNNMYGVIRDGADETLSCTHSGNTATVSITRGSNTGSFSFTVSTPDPEKVLMPEKGWPVIMAMGWFFQTEYANKCRNWHTADQSVDHTESFISKTFNTYI